MLHSIMDQGNGCPLFINLFEVRFWEGFTKECIEQISRHFPQVSLMYLRFPVVLHHLWKEKGLFANRSWLL